MDNISSTTISEKKIKDYGVEIEDLTVSEIEKETGKTGRSIKAYLTLNGISCKDYDGKVRRAQAKAEREVKHEAMEQKLRDAELNFKNAESKIKSGMDSIWEIRKISDNIFTEVSLFYVILWLALSFWGFSANGLAFLLFWLLLSFALFGATLVTWDWLKDKAEKNRISSMSQEEQINYSSQKEYMNKMQSEASERYANISRYGSINLSLICPHCQTKGGVRSKSAEEIARTKVIPIIGNTIKTRKSVMQMHCDNCGTTWNI